MPEANNSIKPTDTSPAATITACYWFTKRGKNGPGKPTIQDNMNSKPMRMNIVMKRLIFRAISCCALACLSSRIEMKMMLSVPSTSLSSIKLEKATRIGGSDSRTSIFFSQVLKVAR